MAHLNPHIHFNGNAEEAFLFYQSAFGTKFNKLLRYGDLANGDYPIADADSMRIMRVSLQIGTNSFLLGSDVMSMMGRVSENENRNTISIATESREEADRLFKILSADGQIEMPMADGPFGTYFGMLRDKFGVQWMVELT